MEISTECKELQRRLDVRAETSLFAARPLLLWAFQSSQWQLQAICGQRTSLPRVTAAQSHALGSHFGAEQRRNFLICSCLSATLAMRFTCVGSACAVTHPLRIAAWILSRRHALHGRLGGVAAAGVGFVRVIGSGVQFQFPSGGVAFDGEGNLVVCDSANHCIQVLRYIDGAHVRTIGRAGRGDVQFDYPWSIAFDGAGHIIVSEGEGNHVKVLRYSDGTHVRTIGRPGSGYGEFFHAKGVAIDGEGNVAVFDSGNARVSVFRLSDGAYIRTIGSRGSGNGQFGVGGDGGVAFDSEGNLAVADCDNHRVQVLRYSDGTHLRTIGSRGSAGQFDNPTGVAFDAAGHIVVVDQINSRVQVLRYSDGAHVRTIENEFSDPQGGIAIDSDGRIVVADTYNDRVQVLE